MPVHYQLENTQWCIYTERKEKEHTHTEGTDVISCTK